MKKAIIELLSDRERSYRPPRISPAQQTDLAAKACGDPQDLGRPISQWSNDELAYQMSQIPNAFATSGGWVRRLLAHMDSLNTHCSETMVHTIAPDDRIQRGPQSKRQAGNFAVHGKSP